MCAMEVFLEKEIALKTCILIVFLAFFWDNACLLDFSLKDTFIKILESQKFFRAEGILETIQFYTWLEELI